MREKTKQNKKVNLMGTVKDDADSGQLLLPCCSVTPKCAQPVSLGVSTNHEEHGRLMFSLSTCQNPSSGRG